MRAMVAQINSVDAISVYHPDGERFAGTTFESPSCAIVATSDFSDLASCAAVLICSPGKTHRTYLERLLEHDLYILCEKPIGVTREELAWLTDLPDDEKARIYCNHNYALTDFCLSAEDMISSGQAGVPIHLDISATHGLSFKDSFKDNWRFSDRDAFASVLGNVGIHYFHMALRLFGDVKHVACHKLRSNPSSEDADTCAIMMQTEAGQTISIHLSYSTPYTNRARLLLSDGMLEMDDGCLRKYGTRESYDPSGRFATPEHEVINDHTSSKSYYDESLMRSLDVFVDVAAHGGRFSSDYFNQAVHSASLTLDSYEQASTVDLSTG